MKNFTQTLGAMSQNVQQLHITSARQHVHLVKFLMEKNIYDCDWQVL